MIQQIIGKIIAHRAAIALGGAMVGTVAVAVLAAKDGRKHQTNLLSADAEKLTELDDDQLYEYEEIEDHHPGELLNKKEKAIIFAKSYWRTGMAMAVTFALMIFSHKSMAKEIAATAAALGVVSAKYKDLQSYLKENYPEQYAEITRRLNRKNARKKISEKPLKKEETYDGRKRYYFPKSDQIVYMKPEDLVEVQGFIMRRIGTTMEVYLNEILDYIHYDLGYKDVHLADVDYKWAFGEESVGEADFPQMEFEFDDVLSDDGKAYVVCQVITLNYEPELVTEKSA